VKVVGLALALGAALFLSALPASAATVGVTYSGKVTSVSPTGTAPFAIDDTFSFTVVLDDTVPDSEPTAGLGIYWGAITQLTGSFSNGYHFAMDPAAAAGTRLGIGNDVTDGISINAGGSFSGPLVDAKPLVSVSLSFFDPTGNMLNSEGIPTDLVSVMAYSTTSSMFMSFGLAGQFVYVQGEVLSAATPIPAALPLLISALGGLGLVGWRRRRVA